MEKNSKIKRRLALNKIKPYQPGKPIWELQSELDLDQVVKLASNENPIGPSPKAVEVLQYSLSTLNRYPDAHATRLKEVLAAHLSLSTEQFIITNGADELITLISETYLEPNDEIIVLSPSFSEYQFGANLMGANIVSIPLDNRFQINIHTILSSVTDHTKLVYVCSPNNPTGTYLSSNDLEALLLALPEHVLLVLDAAYSHFATNTDYTDGLEFVRSGHQLIVLQTFSKIYGLAGIRIGFGAAPSSIIGSITSVKEPFNVNTLAQYAAASAIEDVDHVNQSKLVNTSGRKQLYEAFSRLGLSYIESMANFVFVKIGHEAKRVYERLLEGGVIVRHGDAWEMPEYLRVSVGTQEENAKFIKQLELIKSKAE